MTATDMTPQDTKAAAKDRQEASSVDARILLSVFFFLAAWAGSIVTWGIPGLYLPALALVPVVWVALIIISRG